MSARLRNPTRWALRCDELNSVIGAGRVVVVSDAEADQITGTVFEIERDAPVEEEPPAPAAPPATRKTTTRGSKATEVTEGPDRETR